jgi:hypothetical protein
MLGFTPTLGQVRVATDTRITFEELEKTPSKRWFKCGCKYMFD